MTMNTSPRPTDSLRIAFWLVPSTDDQRRLGQIINRLADEYNAPRFMPHITLWSTELAIDESPQQILETTAREFTPFSLESSGLDHGPNMFKSIFIRFSSEPLIQLSQALGSSCQYPGDYNFDAHLSLLYRQLRAEERKKIISQLQLPQSSFYFNTVAATTPGRGLNSFENVNKWQHVARLSLKSP